MDESWFESQFRAIPDPEHGFDAWSVYRKFAANGAGGRPGVWRHKGSVEFRLGEPRGPHVDLVVQVADSPALAFTTPSQFTLSGPGRCPVTQRVTPGVLLRRENVSVLVLGACPSGPARDVAAEVALVRRVLDSL